ncbi:recombinase family protein [Microbispora sp. H10885]|uniref:recombinase family protein n=1 Tax=Microbispora sp. H10885 TaxID=2729110 RepID=UPI00160074D5
MNCSLPRPPHQGRGRPPVCPPEVVARVLHLRAQGLSLIAISELLNAEGVLTPTGRSRWTKSHVDRLLHTRHAQRMIAM